MVWLIPVVPNVSLRGLIAPFQNSVWYAVGVVLILTILIKILILRDITFLDVFALVIGTSPSAQPIKLSSRIQFVSWAFFGYVLSQSYLASLAGVLVEAANQQIETMEELIFAGIQFGGTKQHRELFAVTDADDDDFYDDISDSDVIQAIYNNFVVLQHAEYVQHLGDLINGRNKDMALVAMLNVSSTERRFDKTKVQPLKEPLGIYPLAFAVSKGLPYLDQINKKIMTLDEGGFVQFWERSYIGLDAYLSGDDASSDIIGLHQLVPGFLLLIIGLLAGIVAFFSEITAHNLQKKKIIKRNVEIIATIWLKKVRRNRAERTKKAKNQINLVKMA